MAVCTVDMTMAFDDAFEPILVVETCVITRGDSVMPNIAKS